MRKFIHTITPAFISAYNERLLKNAPLGWQLQLPTITWLWLLVTLITLPIPFVVEIDTKGDDDIVAIILISVLTAVLEGFLFVYILILFNNTKTFGKRVCMNGFKEQLGYFYVCMLCMMHIIFYPLIIDIRKGNVMTAKEIQKEAIIYNTASFYFMGKPEHYSYFPSQETFLKYKLYAYNSNYSDVDRNKPETYYIEELKPMMKAYFQADSEVVDSQCTRDIEKCPKLYQNQNHTLTEVYYPYSRYGFLTNAVENKEKIDPVYFESYQLKKKTDAERLKDIQNLIDLYFKYNDRTSITHMDSASVILEKYKTNRFIPVMYDTAYVYDEEYAVIDVNGNPEINKSYTSLEEYQISQVHSTISDARNNKVSNVLLRLLITLHVALGLSILLFLFKNVRLKEFILTFVYVGLLTLAVSVLNIIFHGREDFPLHVVLLVFFVGIYFSFFNKKVGHFSSVKTIFIIVSNAAFAYAPIFLFMYCTRYHHLGALDTEINCNLTPDVCSEHRALMNLIEYTCLWGGPLLYLLVGSTLYKKIYERVLALPFAK